MIFNMDNMDKISNISTIIKNENENENEKEDNNITDNDIKSMINILNICNQRGSFKINELKDIGIFYERLNEILNKKEI